MTSWGGVLTVEVSSAEPDADPVWVDITEWVIRPGGTRLETSLGRATELTISSEPGRGSLLLNNTDERFTPGNPSSPYFPWWKQSRRIRIREAFGEVTYDLGDGYLEIPENIVQTQTLDGSIRIITLSVTWLDVLGRLQNAQEFVSTLAAANLYAGGSSLIAYYPLNDQSGAKSAANITATSREPLALGSSGPSLNGVPASTPGGPYLVFGNGDSLAGDDAASATGSPVVNGGLWSYSTFAEAKWATPIEQASGETIAMVWWCTYDGTTIDTLVPATIRNDDDITLTQDMLLYYTSGTWTARWHPPSSSLTEVAVPGPQTDKPTLIALRLTLPSGLCEYWLDDDTPVTTTLGGSIPTSASWVSAAVAGPWAGTLGHLQVYVGVDAYTYEDHLAQFAAGWHGLERQTTGERINTILDYAGFPANRRDIDPGVAVMQNASLAGQDPRAAMTEALNTERGRLFASGGRVIFHDRRRVYNI